MQALQDIFDIFGPQKKAVRNMAIALNEKTDTVYRWRKKGQIPPHAWPALIEAAKERGKKITASDLLKANTPTRKKRAAIPKMQARGIAA